MDLEYAVIQDNQTIKYFVAGLTISSLVFVLVIYVWMIHRHRQTYWVSTGKNFIWSVNSGAGLC